MSDPVDHTLAESDEGSSAPHKRPSIFRRTSAQRVGGGLADVGIGVGVALGRVRDTLVGTWPANNLPRKAPGVLSLIQNLHTIHEHVAHA